MLNVVTGLMMLAGAVVREQGQSFDDVAFRREVEVRGAASETQTNGARVTVVAGPPIGTMTMSGIEGEPLSTSGQGEADDLSREKSMEHHREVIGDVLHDDVERVSGIERGKPV